MKKILKTILILFALLAIKTSYSQTVYTPAQSPGRPSSLYYGPLKFWILDGGGWLVHCENENNQPCAATFMPSQIEDFLPMIGYENTIVGIYDLPNTPDKPRYVVVSNQVGVQALENGTTALTLNPPR
jgi:hypothetical protein